MPSRTIIALLVLVLTPATPALASHPDLLVNGDFTLGFTGWTQWGAPGACTHAISRVHDALGEYHLVDTTTWASCGLYQAVSVQTGATYRGSVWVDVHSGLVQLHVRFVDAGGNDVGPVHADTSVGTGGQVLAAQGTAPVGATHVRFWVYVPTSYVADVHADDAMLVAL